MTPGAITGLWNGIKRLGGRSVPNDPRLRELFHRCKSNNPKNLLQLHANESRFVVLDTETTGFHAYGGDEIISIAMIEMEGLEPTGREYQTLVNPKRPIPPESTEIHQITDEMVTDSPTIDDVLPDIVEFMDGAVIVGHHINFDLRFLNKTLKIEVGCQLPHPWLDTMLMFLALTGRMGHYTLEEVAKSCRVTLHDRHTAHGDALTTAEIFITMMQHGDGHGMTIEQLVKWQHESGHFA